MSDSKERRLQEIYRQIDNLDFSTLADLNKGITLYSQAQMIIGFLDADALYQYGSLYSARKQKQAEIIQQSEGTVADREAQAELDTYFLRTQEWDAKSESRKWQNLFKATDNLIIALRRDRRTAVEEYNKANDIYGR